MKHVQSPSRRAEILAVALTLSVATFGNASAANAADPVDVRTRDALLAAIADEHAAEAYYRAVMDRFGDVLPFAKIVTAEQRHAAELEQLCRKYDVDVPSRSAAGDIAVPDTLVAACAVAVEAEKKNVAMYDGLLAAVPQPDVRQAFERLQTASRERHLPAFTRCAGATEPAQAGVQSEPPTCGSCGMGAACGCANASQAEKKARAAAGGGCGCAKARQKAEAGD